MLKSWNRDVGSTTPLSLNASLRVLFPARRIWKIETIVFMDVELIVVSSPHLADSRENGGMPRNDDG